MALSDRSTRTSLRLPDYATMARFYALPVLLLGVVLALRVFAKIPVSYFTRDPAATMGGTFYVGLISQCGALAWCAAAACCIFAGVVAYRLQRIESAQFLLASGLLTVMLLLDDYFQLHEIFYRLYLGLPEMSVVGIYALLVGVYLLRFYAVIKASEYGLLFLAFGLFGASVAIDQFLSRDGHAHQLMEDGAKFLGIMTWLFYFSRTSLAHVLNVDQVAYSGSAGHPIQFAEDVLADCGVAIAFTSAELCRAARARADQLEESIASWGKPRENDHDSPATQPPESAGDEIQREKTPLVQPA